MAVLGEKLTFLMKNSACRITDEALGNALHVDRSTVNKWRKGTLRLDKAQYADQVADFLVQHLDRQWLLSLLNLPETEAPHDAGLRGQIVDFLYDDGDIILRRATSRHIVFDRQVINNGCFLGVQGLFDALALFSSCLEKKDTRKPVCMYLSSEYCGLLLDQNADLLWDYLYEINEGRPVRIVFERWRETGRVTEIFNRLLPFILQKKVELYYIPSTERFFCYNISFLAENNCMVMTTEPAGGCGTSVSIYVDSQEFVIPMSKVMGKLERLARPVARFIETPRAETTCTNTVFGEEGDVSALFDGINLLYAAPEEFEALLESCGLSYQERRHHVRRFKEQQESVKRFLTGNMNREIFMLETIDDYITSAKIKIHELSFPVPRVKVGLTFLESLLRGMMNALDDFENLRILLVRRGDCWNMVWHMKEDRAILLHCFDGEDRVCIYSENSLFIEYYMGLLENTHQGKHTIRGKANVRIALQSRLDQIHRIQEGESNGK